MDSSVPELRREHKGDALGEEASDTRNSNSSGSTADKSSSTADKSSSTADKSSSTADKSSSSHKRQAPTSTYPSKRSKPRPSAAKVKPTHLGPQSQQLTSCRSIDKCYTKQHKIAEGTYGIVYSGEDKATGEKVALKQLKLEQERNGFPVTSLREIHTLLLSKHANIIDVREIVQGRALNSIYIVMGLMEHDLRSLLETMREPFVPSETKSLMHQLLSGIAHLHANWIIHRDLKTSNLLIANGGELRIGDFGLARKFSSPVVSMTGLVVTLWYRAPELLFGETRYSTAVDVWSAGCIFAELFTKTPLFKGRGEIDQIAKIFEMLGVPTEDTWPGFARLPNARTLRFRDRRPLIDSWFEGVEGVTENARDLIARMLALDPARRISAAEALDHPYFSEMPPPKHPRMFPTWPSSN